MAAGARLARVSARSLDVGQRHRIDIGHDLIEARHPAPDLQHARQAFSPVRRAFQPHQQARLHLRAGAVQFNRAHIFGRAFHFIHSDLRQIGHLLGRCARVDRRHACIRIGSGLRINRVTEPALFAHLLEQPR